MRRLARTLMAGEQVAFMEKPDTKILLAYEAILAAGGFVVLFLFLTMFSDLPINMKASMAVVFSLLSAGILHFTIGTCTYVVTDQRLLIINDLNSELKDSCALEDITIIKRIGFANSLILERNNGGPMRLVALKNRNEAEQAIVGS